MSGMERADLVWIASVAFLGFSTMYAVCRTCLKRKLASIHALWDDIYVQIVERCVLVGALSDHLRKRLKVNPKIVDDIQFLLRRMSETNDPHTQAAVQNGLVLTVQTAVEQFHRSEEMKQDSSLYRTMEAIGLVDSQLATLRDRFNDRIRRYNRLLNTLPFSVAARIMRAPERPLFPMLIPWWSMDPAAYGSISADDIRQTLQTWRAPLILAPTQRPEWGDGKPVIRVADELLKRRQPTNGRVSPNGGTEGAGEGTPT